MLGGSPAAPPSSPWAWGTNEQLVDATVLLQRSAISQDKEFTVRLKKTATGAVVAGVLALGALGGAGLAQAKPHGPDPCVPGISCWPPGHNGWGAPGQVMQGNPVVPGLTGVPPGHWDKPWEFGLPATWRPFDRDDIPWQPVVWNPDLATWGIWWLDQFIPFSQ